MLIQLHHQHKNGKVDFPDSFCSQRDMDCGDYDAMRNWMKETQKNYPLPEGMMWMFCTEESKHFIKTHKEGE